MRFYDILSEIKKIQPLFEGDYEDNHSYLRSHDYHKKVKEVTADTNKVFRSNAYLCIYRMDQYAIKACLLVKDCVDFETESEVRSYFNTIGIQTKKPVIQETTFEEFKYSLRVADHSDFIDDDDDVLEDLGLVSFSNRESHFFSLNYSESLFEISTNESIERKRSRLLTASDLKDEIARIKAPRSMESIQGHPVHYLILSDDKEVRENTLELLMNHLFKEKRLASRRICQVSGFRHSEISQAHAEALFSICHEGAMAITLPQIQNFESDRLNSSLTNIEILCDCVKKHRNDVLTIFFLPKECTQLKNYLFENLGSLSFVEIDEKGANRKRACQFLRTMAKDKGLVADKSLFAKIQPDETYLTPELRMMLEEWFSKKLRTEVYPQYAQFKMAKTDEAQKEAKGSSYDELMEMVGLDEAKEVIKQAIDFHKMQHFLASQDIVRERPAQHMIFTGNPGTAKTTVARLFAHIMRENELLSTGHIIEVGRGDLVGKYVGHTAPLVKLAFKKAKGGVLFIDEAYSLVDDRDGCFGDEAINTIVQEMENNRDKVIVIFAGYPDKMEQFLQKNPGLRSRIAFHLPFPDYSAAELGEIAKLVANKKGMQLSDDAQEKLLTVFESAREEEDFGNGRFVRSTIEKAMMAQASRIVKNDLESITKTELNLITAEDIEEPESTKPKRIQIGFCA